MIIKSNLHLVLKPQRCKSKIELSRLRVTLQVGSDVYVPNGHLDQVSVYCAKYIVFAYHKDAGFLLLVQNVSCLFIASLRKVTD